MPHVHPPAVRPVRRPTPSDALLPKIEAPMTGSDEVVMPQEATPSSLARQAAAAPFARVDCPGRMAAA